MKHVSDSNIFDKVDWLVDDKSFDACYFDGKNNVFVEGPAFPEIINQVKQLQNVLVGRNTYKLVSGMFSPNVIIGRYCSISHNVNIGATNHNMNFLSTGFFQNTVEADISENNGYTIIGCDVWIGVNATIIGGAKIGHGAVIGAGAVIKKEIPPYAIVVGNPAKIIKYRFSDEVIADLLDTKWWTLDSDIIKTLPYKNIKECISILKEIRKN